MKVNVNAKPSAGSKRRPLRSRQAPWALPTASLLHRIGVTPDQISIASVVSALVGAALYVFTALSSSTVATAVALVAAAVCIQLRLLCNLMDGLVAVECGQASRLGPLFNEVPDRIADTLFLVGAGVACHTGSVGIVIGLSAALLAVGTAYLRAVGSTLTDHHDFSGPMAKQHRMFTLTIASLASAIEILSNPNHLGSPWCLVAGLAIISSGSVLTCYRRLSHLSKRLVNQ